MHRLALFSEGSVMKCSHSIPCLLFTLLATSLDRPSSSLSERRLAEGIERTKIIEICSTRKTRTELASLDRISRTLRSVYLRKKWGSVGSTRGFLQGFFRSFLGKCFSASRVPFAMNAIDGAGDHTLTLNGCGLLRSTVRHPPCAVFPR